MVALSEQEEQRFGELCQMAFNFARNDDCENLKAMIEAVIKCESQNTQGRHTLDVSKLPRFHKLRKNAFTKRRTCR